MGFLDKLRKANEPANRPATVLDPVCGMTIASPDAAGTSQHAGRTVYFCSASCKQKFDADPAAYASKV